MILFKITAVCYFSLTTDGTHEFGKNNPMGFRQGKFLPNRSIFPVVLEEKLESDCWINIDVERESI